jgi:uncharacterized membrane protein
MYGSELFTFSFWWTVPIVMMIFCFFMMRRRGGTMMSGFGCCGRDWQQNKGRESSMDILDRRYASGDIDKTEYEEKKRTLTGPIGPKQSE